MDIFENVCCNIRNVKSNYLKCIASQSLSPPCVRVAHGLNCNNRFLMPFDQNEEDSKSFPTIIEHPLDVEPDGFNST